MSNLNNKIQKVNELCYGKFISLYDLEYKNKLNENKHWTVATRKDKEAVEDFYLNRIVYIYFAFCILAGDILL